MRVIRALCVSWALCMMPVCALAASPKRVVILAGEALDLPGPTVLVSAIESTVRKEAEGPVEFYIETVDTSRFRSEAYEQRLAELLIEKYGPEPVDLVVTFTEPSVNFLIRHRERIFPRTPVLFGLVEESFIDRSIATPDSTSVFIRLDTRGTLDLALAANPGIRHVLVVAGRSRMDRKWMDAVRQETTAFDGTVTITYDVDSSIEELTSRVAGLPADTVVLYVSVSVDGAGVPARPREVLKTLRAASSVPIYGMSTTFLGYGIVGGSVLDFDRHGLDLGKQAVRLLSGERPGSITTPNLTAVDWREIQRFQLSTAGLPPSTRIVYRDPSLWEREKRKILLVSAVVLAQSVLIVALVRAGRRRRETQRALENAEQILRDFSHRLLLAQEEERHHIARELHDHLSQQLALLAIDLQQLDANPPASPAALSSGLTEAWRRTTEIASDVHSISHRLHPSKLEALGLVPTIRAHCRDVSRQSLAVHFTEEHVPARIPSDMTLCLFRVVEEALSNVARHSGASEARVTLVNGDGNLTLRVSDAGRGFTVNGNAQHGLGLISMRERLNALGGSLTITSAPGEGTVVEARVPLPVPAPEPPEAGTIEPAELRLNEPR